MTPSRAIRLRYGSSQQSFGSKRLDAKRRDSELTPNLGELAPSPGELAPNLGELIQLVIYFQYNMIEMSILI